MTEDSYVELHGRGEALLREFLAAERAAQEWTERKEQLTRDLIAFMGLANKATIGGRHILTRVGTGTINTFSATRFKAAYPDLYRDFVVPTPRSPYLRVVTPK